MESYRGVKPVHAAHSKIEELKIVEIWIKAKYLQKNKLASSHMLHNTWFHALMCKIKFLTV